MPISPMLDLNDGRRIPQLGFGVFQVPDTDAPSVVGLAIETGYRAIDTAAGYGNERGVGEAVRSAAVPREELFITTKLRNDDHGHDEALRAFDRSLARLGLDEVDLYLIHWPKPKLDRYVETWRAFVRLKQEGRARSIGVSNFTIANLERVIGETGVTPVVNQIELHPQFQQKALRDFHARHGIATESWSPLGRGRLLEDRTIVALAAKHGKTPAQILIRWHLDSGLVVIPKSVTPARIRENFEVFDFRLDADDMALVAAVDDESGRIGPNPDTATF